jgi:regulator of Ty1 transposition protein 103
LREEVLKELANTSVQAPEPMELISMIHDLESSASSDAIIRQKIAELPPKVIDANGVKSISDKKV